MGPVSARSDRRRRRPQSPRIPGRAQAPGQVTITSSRAVPPEALGSGVVGNELTDRLTAQRASWDSLKNDIYASPLADAAFRQGFTRDANAFLSFVVAHESDWVVTHSSLDMAEQYRQRLESWRMRFERLGGRSTAAPTDAPPPGLLDQAGGAGRILGEADDALTTIKWVAGAAIVLGGAYALSRVL